MRSTPELDASAGLTKLATYPFQVATWVDDFCGALPGASVDHPVEEES